MIKFLFEIIIVILLVRFIFNFLIPLFNTTRMVKNQMNDLSRKMQDAQQQANANQGYQTRQQVHQQPKRDGDYIEFEEVK